MKRIISIFLAAVMCMSLMPGVSAFAQDSDRMYLNMTGTQLGVGDTQTLTAVICQNGNFTVAEDVSWESTDESVAAVVDGEITAVSEGSAVIIATGYGYAAECVVNVTDDSKLLYFEEEWIHVNEKGQISLPELKGSLKDAADVTYIAVNNANTDFITETDGVYTASTEGLVEFTASADNSGEPVTAKCCVTIGNYGLSALASIHMAIKTSDTNQHMWQMGYMTDEGFEPYDTLSQDNRNGNIYSSSDFAGRGFINLNGFKWHPGDDSAAVFVWQAPKSGTVTVGAGTQYNRYLMNAGTENKTGTERNADKVSVKLSVIHNDDTSFEQIYESAETGTEGVYYFETSVAGTGNSTATRYFTGDSLDSQLTSALTGINVTKGDKLYFVLENLAGEPTLTMNQQFFRVNYTKFDENVSISFPAKAMSDEAGKNITNIPVASGSDIVYYSDNTDVADVAPNGTVTLKAEGSCRIYAIADDKVADYYDVTATASKKILMNYKTAEIKMGKTLKLKAAYYADSDVYDDVFELGTFNWESSDKAVADVDDDGVVKAMSEGSARITVTDGEKSASCTVYVTPDSLITLSDTDAGIAASKSYKLTAILDESIAGSEITWTSSDTTVASVDDGNVTAMGSGISLITATASDGSTASCVVYCGEINQEKYHDNNEVGMWKYHYAENGTMNLQELPEYNQGNKRYYKNSSVFVQQNDMSFDSTYDVFRTWQAPASGTVEISVNNTNRIYGVNAQNGAKGEFQLIAGDKVVKSFIFESKKKDDGTYYTSTRYNGAGPGVDGNNYDMKESFSNSFGTVELNVTKGEQIHFAWRRVEGASAYLGTSSGGFKIKYTSNDALYNISASCDTLNLIPGEISTQSKAILDGKGTINDTVTYYCDDTSVAMVSAEGAVKAINSGTATVYAVNAAGTLINYVEIIVSEGDFIVSEPVFNKEKDGTVTVSAKAQNSGTKERSVVIIAVARDEAHIPVDVYKSEKFIIAADGVPVDLTVSGIDIDGASTIDVYILESETSVKPLIDWISKRVSQI